MTVYCLEVFEFGEQLTELLFRESVVFECFYFARYCFELLCIPLCSQFLNAILVDDPLSE